MPTLNEFRGSVRTRGNDFVFDTQVNTNIPSAAFGSWPTLRGKLGSGKNICAPSNKKLISSYFVRFSDMSTNN